MRRGSTAEFRACETALSEQQFVGGDERAESGQRHKTHDGRQAKRSNDEWPESRASRWIAHPPYLFFYRAASMLKARQAARGRVSRMFWHDLAASGQDHDSRRRRPPAQSSPESSARPIRFSPRWMLTLTSEGD